VGKQLPMPNEIIIESAWSEIDLVSGTTGELSYSIAPSIQNTTEYASLSGLFTEVKLLKATYTFYAVQANSTSTLHSKLSMGANMIFTAPTFSLPTAYASVLNLRKPVTINTWRVSPFTYNYTVPPGIEFANINNDSPTVPTPYAGSPGALVLYANDLSVTTNYFRVNAKAKWHLRSRQ